MAAAAPDAADNQPWLGVTKEAIKDLSALANEELVLLLFQLELDTQLQRALNYEAFDVAQEIRRRRDEVRITWSLILFSEAVRVQYLLDSLV